ncbi:MAG: tyrosine-type recombinase/integrase [Treponema sp.]|jgi:site-specific recombinase XerD|nr:tyrosine-type recombinase/integrase [Treponema sp.]
MVATYRGEMWLFLYWLTETQICLETADTLSLLRYLEQRHTWDAISSRTTATVIVALRSFFCFIINAGLRVTETVSLNVWVGLIVVRERRQGNKERFVIFGGETASWLKRYLMAVHSQLAGSKQCSALFISSVGRWKTYAQNVTPVEVSSKLHTLRHTFVTDLLARRADLWSMQELLGYADLTTIQIYIQVFYEN